MLVRRMATVTISAPEASIAARVCSKSLYLPVPTRSRDRKARPAMTRRSSCASARFSLGAFIRRSASAYGADNFDAVSGGESRVAVAAPGHDLAVSLDGDA